MFLQLDFNSSSNHSPEPPHLLRTLSDRHRRDHNPPHLISESLMEKKSKKIEKQIPHFFFSPHPCLPDMSGIRGSRRAQSHLIPVFLIRQVSEAVGEHSLTSSLSSRYRYPRQSASTNAFNGCNDPFPNERQAPRGGKFRGFFFH